MSIGNQPAFPALSRQLSPNNYEALSEGGLTKREYFAGRLAPAVYAEYMRGVDDLSSLAKASKAIATWTVAYADALVAELEREGK